MRRQLLSIVDRTKTTLQSVYSRGRFEPISYYYSSTAVRQYCQGDGYPPHVFMVHQSNRRFSTLAAVCIPNTAPQPSSCTAVFNIWEAAEIAPYPYRASKRHTIELNSIARYLWVGYAASETGRRIKIKRVEIYTRQVNAYSKHPREL